MTIAELRALLLSVPQDLNVFTAYDSMVCVDNIGDIMLIKDGDSRGLYFCAGSASAEYAIESGEEYKGGELINRGERQ